MSRISLRKALQLKKNLTGDISKLRDKINRFNCSRYENKHINIKSLNEEFNKKIEDLIKLKTAISVANIGVYSYIVSAEELKGLISFYESLNTQENGIEYKNGETIPFNNYVGINYSECESIVKLLKNELSEVLEKIDDYNSSHYIDLPY